MTALRIVSYIYDQNVISILFLVYRVKGILRNYA